MRQVERLVIRYRESGAAGLASRQRGGPGNRRLDADLAQRALTIIRDRYADFGPTLACEKLWECHGIRLAKETVRRLMTEAGFWVPRRQRPPKVYQPRARRACLGELIQIDGSEHRWFEDRAPQCTLLVYVDDATSRLMMLHFTATESTFSYFGLRGPTEARQCPAHSHAVLQHDVASPRERQKLDRRNRTFPMSQFESRYDIE